MATDITTSEQGANFDQHQIEWTLSFLGEQTEKVNRKAKELDPRVQSRRMFYIILAVMPITCALIGWVVFSYAPWVPPRGPDGNPLPESVRPVGWGVVLGLILGPLMTLLMYREQLFDFTRLKWQCYELSVQIDALRRVMERVSQFSEFHPPEWELQLQLDIRLTEAESALLFAERVLRRSPPSPVTDPARTSR